MKHCSECLEEYRDDFEPDTCPECGGELIPGESPRYSEEGAQQWGSFEELTRVSNQWEADLLKGRLEVEGLHPIQRPSRYYADVNLPPEQVAGGITILLRPEEPETAREILRLLEEQAQADTQTEGIQAVVPNDSECDDCGVPEDEPNDPDLDSGVPCSEE